jgi:hypothetical protein
VRTSCEGRLSVRWSSPAWRTSRPHRYTASERLDHTRSTHVHQLSRVAREYELPDVGEIVCQDGPRGSDWFGFRVGVADPRNIAWNAEGNGALACLCVPSAHNRHVTPEIDPVPSPVGRLPPERRHVAHDLRPVLEKSVLSVSFSRAASFALSGGRRGRDDRDACVRAG